MVGIRQMSIWATVVTLGACVLLGADPLSAQVAGSEPWVLQIGVPDGDEAEIFGHIHDVLVDDFGNVYVLDDQAFTLSWFGPDGGHRGTAGRAGGGPGEFRSPVDMILDDRGRVHVLDYAAGRISIFEGGDAGLTLIGEVTTYLHAVAFCRLSDRYYLLVPEGDSIIHAIDAGGGALRTFGEPVADIPPELRPHAPVLTGLLNYGRLYCHQDPPTIVLLSDITPLVRAFRPDGSEIWRTELRDYHQQRWELTRGGRGLRVAADPESGTAHTGEAVARIGRDSVVITLREASLADPIGELEARIVSLWNGREIGLGRADAVIAATRDSLVYGYVNDPYPRVLVSRRLPIRK
jgi:hypothetical protein